jgi:hypothetical protein
MKLWTEWSRQNLLNHSWVSPKVNQESALDYTLESRDTHRSTVSSVNPRSSAGSKTRESGLKLEQKPGAQDLSNSLSVSFLRGVRGSG